MLQCQERDLGIQCLNPSIYSSSRCAIHQPRNKNASTPEPSYAATTPEPFSYDSDFSEPVDYPDEPQLGFCAAQTRLGKPCMASKQRTRPYCISHDPEFRRQHLINSRDGGLNARRRCEGVAALLDVDVVDLRTRGDIQALIDTVLRLELSGKIPAARSRAIARLISLAVHNFDRIPRRDRADGDISVHDPGYYDTRNALDLEIEDIASNLQHAETAEADREFENRRRLLQTENELRTRPKSARTALINSLTNLATRP